MKFTLICLFAALLSSPAVAQETYTLKLNKGDSVLFDEILNGFSGPKKVVDPEYGSVFYSKRWYQSQNQAVTIACQTITVDGEFYTAYCYFEFRPENSSLEARVEKKANGVIRATINDSAAATQMYKNLEMNPFYSNETIGIVGISGEEKISRVYAECSPVVIMYPQAKNCVIEFLPE